jgi:squalene-hopene/tetraprenyl-beta-curcumene cyclase
MTIQSAAPVFCAVLLLAPLARGWDSRKAFQYLEESQRRWADWKPAQRNGGPCLSCHTGLGFSFARRAAGETEPRPLEKDLAAGVRTRLLATPPQSAMTDPGAEAVLNFLMLALQRQRRDEPLADADRVAIGQLWERQLRAGKAAGSWTWFRFDLEPWDSETSNYFGAALAARALAAYPAQPAAPSAALRAYLKREAVHQPLHNRLAWIAFDAAADARSKAEVLKQLWAAQASDGGWTTASLGPWSKKPAAPRDPGSNAYSTAWAAFTAHQAGTACSDPRLKSALAWLERRQDPSTGAWNSLSMNKPYPADSIQARFMTDAATGYAAAALLACRAK